MFFLRIVISSALICISFVSCTDSQRVTGKEPVSEVHLVEVHSDTLVRWAESGIRDAVVINIDAHDDIRIDAETHLLILQKLMDEKDWEGLQRRNTLADDGLYDLGNFLHAAAKLGIVKEVYWVIPFPLFRDSNAEAMLQYMLRFSSFSEEVIKTFSLKDGCYSGSYEGIPLTVCGIEQMPEIKDPVILSIDADFFPEYARTYFSTLTVGVTELLDAVNRAGYNIIDTVISFSVSGGFLKPKHRWVADLIKEILREPDLLPGNIPERFMLLQKIDLQIQRGMFAAALQQINSSVLYKDDPAFMTYKAEALFGSGDSEAAFSAAFDACEHNKAYCYELPHIGRVLAGQGRADEAVRFFSSGYEGNSGMDSGQAEYGIALESLGRLNEALAVYKKYRSIRGSSPIDIMITATYIRLGEQASALETLRGVLKKTGPAGSNRVVTEQVAEAIVTVLDFCRLNDYTEELKAFEGSSLVQLHRNRFPSVFNQ